MKEGYIIRDQEKIHFITATIIDWVDVFTKNTYKDIIIDCLAYCIKEKGMLLYGYVIMSNHIHLILQSKTGRLSDLIRDFKGFTARKLIKIIEENPQESRKEFILWMLERAGSKKSNVKKRQFWQQHNKPIELWSEKVIQQKINYI